MSCIKHILSVLAFTSGFIFFSGCSSQQTFTNAENKSDSNKQYENILLLHYGKDYENRKTIENELTYWMREKGYKITPSVEVYQNTTLPTREIIKKTLATNMFDGLLISRLLGITAEDMHTDTQGRYSSYDPNATTYYAWFKEDVNMNTLGYTFKETAFVVETRLFDAETEMVVYSIKTKTYDSKSFDAVVENFSKSTAKSVSKSKLLKSPNN